MANSDVLAIERLVPADLADAEALVAEAGWNQVAADWRIFIDYGTAYAVRSGGRVIATAATLPYGGHCAWISMMLVAGTHRRQGLATRLLHRCIADITASGLIPVLDATPAGAKVYAPLGFQPTWGFARLASQRCTIEAPQTGDIAVHPVADADWPALCACDARVFGADRSAVLARLRGRLLAANLFARRGGRVAGLLLGRDGRTSAHLGPLIAEDDAVAQALLAQVLRHIEGPVYIDVADTKPELRGFLEASGFSAQRPFTRMLLGRRGSFDDGSRTYAVIGPEFG